MYNQVTEEVTNDNDAQLQPSDTKEEEILSFRNAKYESAEMQLLLSLHTPEEKVPTGLDDVSYHPNLVFPEWVLQNANWKLAAKMNATSKSVSEILKVHFSKRTPEQVSTAIHWLMSVWKIANTMGFKRCGSMLKEFKMESFKPGEHIIREGDRGLTFYIIIDGRTSVHKEGIGIVGYLGKGKSFGEIALTQGKDLRTATIIAETDVDVVSLHKSNYDYFVRDIQDQEKRENFKILSECSLFRTWPKGKIEKMSNSCVRKTLDPGQYVFHQGDPPKDLCIIVEGSVEIVKELVIVCKNRWPVAINKWKEMRKKIHKPILLKTLGPSGFFGEMAILKDMPRSTSAIATSRTVLLSLDRLEFLHLISYGSSNINGNALQEEEQRFNQIINKYIDDQDILDAVTYFKGGPDSEAVVGVTKILKNELHSMHTNDPQLPEEITKRHEAIVRKPMHHSHSKKTSVRSRHQTEEYKQQQFQKEILRISEGEALMQRMQVATEQAINDEITKEERMDALLGPSYTASDIARRRSRSNSLGGGAKFAAGRKQRGPSEKGGVGTTRSLYKDNSSPLSSRRGSTAIKFGESLPSARFGSISGSPMHRKGSLPGIDNDSNSAAYSQRILLRNNSAISVSAVYDEVYRQLHSTDAWVEKIIGDEQDLLDSDDSIHGRVADNVSSGKYLRKNSVRIGSQSHELIDSISRRYIDSKISKRGSISSGSISPLTSPFSALAMGNSGAASQLTNRRKSRLSLDSKRSTSPKQQQSDAVNSLNRRPFSSGGNGHSMESIVDASDDEDDILSIPNTPFNNRENAAIATMEVSLARKKQWRDKNSSASYENRTKRKTPPPLVGTAASSGASTTKLLGKAKLTYKEAMHG